MRHAYLKYQNFNQSALLFKVLLLFLHGFAITREHNFSNHHFVSHTTSPHSVPLIMQSTIGALTFDGHLSFENIDQAAKDFGNRYHLMPSAILYPKSVSDISTIIKYIYCMDKGSDLTIAARGHGHSLEGQAQAYGGVVINMESLPVPEMSFHIGNRPYVDVSAGQLWISILHASLEKGLAPKSWTDYLHLTVGGTLSNAGISGQAFRHGPQINNVYQLEVVTGKGEVVTCSENNNTDLFYAVLGGLGQFGIITNARIALEPAPRMVKWIRALYSDFSLFTKDQELLISAERSFDYIEGFVIINRTGLLNTWRLSFNPKYPVQADQFASDGKILFCLEVAKYFNPDESDQIDKELDTLLSELSNIQSTLFMSEVSYVDFLDRVYASEIRLREKGLWELPHPWINLLIPRSNIQKFAQEVFGNILKDTSNGPVLIYPVDQSRWIQGTSLITPEEDVFYLVAFLSSAVPSSTGTEGLDHILTQNSRILNFCQMSNLGIKQYLPYYGSQEEWITHFGNYWETFFRRKLKYDPLAILAPGQGIFQRAYSFDQQKPHS